MIEQHINFNFKGRYYTLGEINKDTLQIWFVLHGYGQLAQYFLKKFNSLEAKNICVIAPEGLSRFYLEDINTRSQGGSSRVGATWMTKEDRLTDIENYITYLNSIYQKELAGLTSIPPVTLFGFSQGVATVARWALYGSVQFQRLIFWAGILPPDIDFELGKDKVRGKEVIQIYGKQDPFINADRLNEMKKLCNQLEITPQIIEYDGKHEIDESVLAQIK
jgi:predicted esterase